MTTPAPTRPLVSRLIERFRALNLPSTPRPEDKPFLSGNRVVGWSVDFPIARTCTPTKVCVNTCYYARDVTAIPHNLAKQNEVMESVLADPVGSAHRIAAEFKRKRGAAFLRWNGGGDLFPESVECLNTLGKHYPDLPVWVVTRKPKVAALVEEAENVFLHLSLDSSSRGRLQEWLALPKRTTKWFASYQCNRDEDVDLDSLGRAGFSVVFRDGYKTLPKDTGEDGLRVSCPLNGSPSVEDGCKNCGRCWTRAAVDMRNTEALARWAEEPATSSHAPAHFLLWEVESR
jgi:hypothetical protein